MESTLTTYRLIMQLNGQSDQTFDLYARTNLSIEELKQILTDPSGPRFAYQFGAIPKNNKKAFPIVREASHLFPDFHFDKVQCIAIEHAYNIPRQRHIHNVSNETWDLSLTYAQLNNFC